MSSDRLEKGDGFSVAITVPIDGEELERLLGDLCNGLQAMQAGLVCPPLVVTERATDRLGVRGFGVVRPAISLGQPSGEKDLAHPLTSTGGDDATADEFSALLLSHWASLYTGNLPVSRVPLAQT